MATYNEEAKYKTWKVITTDCRGRVEYTYKLMTPSQALEYFRNAVEEEPLLKDAELIDIDNEQ